MKISIDQLPKRIVISRKGSDSAWGGKPSLILGDELISLPIPEHSKADRKLLGACKKHRKYQDLPHHKIIDDYVSYLPELSGQDCVHLDPDIRDDLRSREAQGHKFLFGQSGAAEGHLRNQQIGKNDLFLFFGWFCDYSKVDRRYVPTGPNQHLMWAWFQVEKKHQLEGLDSGNELLKNANHHPHVARMGDSKGRLKKDSLYVATSKLSFANHLPGAGVFKRSGSKLLTRSCMSAASRTEWCVPSFFSTTGLTYNSKALNEYETCSKDHTRIHIKAACIGQEFVFPSDKSKTLLGYPVKVQSQIAVWLESIFT